MGGGDLNLPDFGKIILILLPLAAVGVGTILWGLYWLWTNIDISWVG